MLGAAAGGGLPQWNCACVNCCAARQGRIPALTQSSVAVCGDRGEWFLVNASPDLPAQMRACADLQPPAGTLRGTPVAGVLLTNADLDHVLGLWLLREGGRLPVYATQAVRDTLDAGLGLTPLLEAFCGLAWQEPSENDFVPLINSTGGPSSLLCRAIALPGGPPAYAQRQSLDGIHSVAYYLMDRNTGGRLLVAPDVSAWNDALVAALEEVDAVLFDGTFWSGDELSQVKTQARTAAQMGHVTMRDQSLAFLGQFPAKRRIYLHINNTNPVLSPGSPERAAVVAAGIEIGYDGLEFEL